MSKTTAVVFLFDVDNTLLDNDLVQSHLKEHLADAYGSCVTSNAGPHGDAQLYGR